MNNIEKFDPSTLMEGVKDRIKLSFVSLIPDEQWDSMIKKVVDDYFRPKDRNNYYKSNQSDFEQLVIIQLENFAKEKLKEMMDSPEFMEIWNINGVPVASAAIKKMIIDNSGEILANFYGNIAQQFINNFKNQI